MINKIWYKNKNKMINTNIETELKDKLGLSKEIAKLVSQKSSINNYKEAVRYLFPKKENLHSPFMFKDMEKAVNKIIKTMENNGEIVIWGDFDVDGVTSTALLLRLFEDIGYSNVRYHIPDRTAGYGLNEEGLKEISKTASLVITVDCGIRAVEKIKVLKDTDTAIIITDHHEPGNILPDAYAIINPKLRDTEYPFSGLAGVGVAYKLALAIQQTKRYENLSEYLFEYLDFVAFGTVADIVDLKDENRFMVKQGLEKLNDNPNLGFKALIEVSDYTDKTITPGTIGFILAPKINALGRLENVSEAVLMFFTKYDDAMEIAKKLAKLNEERQLIEKNMLQEALEILPSPEAHNEPIIFLENVDWHVGVKGIVASKLLDIYHKPVMIGTNDGEVCSMSARSINNFHIEKALTKIGENLISYGGHSKAAGFSFKLTEFAKVKSLLIKEANERLTLEDLTPKFNYDLTLKLSDCTIKFVEELEILEPHGMGNPKPKFVVEDMIINDIKTTSSQKHLQIKVTSDRYNLKGIGFNLSEMTKKFYVSDKVSILCNLSINEWRGNRDVQLMVKDIKNNDAKNCFINLRTIEDKNFFSKMVQSINSLENISEVEKMFSRKTIGKIYSIIKKQNNTSIINLSIESLYNGINVTINDSITKRFFILIILQILNEMRYLDFSISKTNNDLLYVNFYNNNNKSDLQQTNMYIEYMNLKDKIIL